MKKYMLMFVFILVGMGCAAQKPPDPAKQQAYREALARKADAKITVTFRTPYSEKKEFDVRSNRAREQGLIIFDVAGMRIGDPITPEFAYNQ